MNMTEQKPTDRTELIIRSLRPFIIDPKKRAIGMRISSTGFEIPSCLYHDPDTGNGCAVGQWLSPEELTKIHEGKSASGNWDELPLWMKMIASSDLAYSGEEFLDELQKFHDSRDYWTDDGPTSWFWTRLQQFCRTWNLVDADRVMTELRAALPVPA